jgi:DegV family protein with EDD domain
MKKIAVVTDSNSGITPAKAQELGVSVLPMPFTVGGQLYFEEINLTQEMFYQKLDEGCEVSTSQPSLGAVKELWDDILRKYDEIVHIPMSSAFSATCASAMMLAEEYGGKVQVVDNMRISVTLRQAVLDALSLVKAGWEAVRIKEYLEQVKLDSIIYFMVDTMKYLQKSGRVSPAIAAIGSILNIKPILQIRGVTVEAFAKARGAKQALGTMIKALQDDLAGVFKDFGGPDKMWLQIAYSLNRAAAENFHKLAEAAFPGYSIHIDPVSLSVACHMGPGALAIACCKKLDQLPE